MRRLTGSAQVALLVTALLFAAWSALTFRTGAFTAMDATSLTPGFDTQSGWGQVLAAIAIVTSPYVVYAVLAGVAFWAYRRRLNNLAWAIGLTIPLTWGLTASIKYLFQRPRPPTASALITAEGYAYPSAHLTAATVLAVCLAAVMVLTRRRRETVVLACAIMAAAWWLIAWNRWALRAHWFSDLFAGGFLGGFIASACLAVAGVHIARLPDAGRARSDGTLRAVIIVNPTKIPDPVIFRRHLEGECAERGWLPPVWMETEPDDAGASAARRARRREPDLVLVAGGDGTVRTVCAALTGSGVPIAILPAGTGNLLARNLGVPLDLADALDLAFEGAPRIFDVIEIRADDRPVDHSLVMAGLGADALIMSETNPDLKKVVGSAAYVMAALQTLNRPPFKATVCLDGVGAVERTPSLALIANVGNLQGSIPLVPDAVPDDGLLDVLLASAQGPAGWAAITTRVLTRAPDAPGIERAQARRVVLETDTPVPFQIDGDAIGTCTRLEATIRPEAITLVTP